MRTITLMLVLLAHVAMLGCTQNDGGPVANPEPPRADSARISEQPPAGTVEEPDTSTDETPERRVAASDTEATKETTPAFPRVDGVYGIKGNYLYGPEEVSVYDYIVFTKGGKVYSITGGYFSPDNYYLEQPTGIPGGFRMKTAPLKDQPAVILKWIAAPDETKPLSGDYTVKGGVVRFTINDPGTRSYGPCTLTYEGRATDNGMKIIRTTTSPSGDRSATFEYMYEFEAVK